MKTHPSLSLSTSFTHARTHAPHAGTQAHTHVRMRACVATHKHTRFLSHFLGTSLPSHIKADCSGSLLLLFTFPWFTPLPRALRTRQRQSFFPLTPLSWWLLKCPSEVTVLFSLGQWTFPFHGNKPILKAYSGSVHFKSLIFGHSLIKITTGRFQY